MKKTIFLAIVLFWVALNSISLAAIIHWNDGLSYTINDNTYQNDHIRVDYATTNNPGTHVDLIDGIVGELDSHRNATITMTGGTVTGELKASGNSTITMISGTVQDKLTAHGGSIVTMSGGSVKSYFQGRSNGTIFMSGGTVDLALEAINNSIIHMSGGSVGLGFGAGMNGIIYLHGTNFEVNGQTLSYGDKLSDFVPLVEYRPDGKILDYYTGIITGILSDGSVLNSEFYIYNKGFLAGTGDIIIRRPIIASRAVLVALSQAEETGLLIRGNPMLTVITDGSDHILETIVVNSSADNAVLVQGKADISADNLNIVGSMSIRGSLSYPEEMIISQDLGNAGIAPDFIDLNEPNYAGLPDLCPVDPDSGKTLPMVISGGEATLEPGYYSAGVIIEDATVSCLPGVYHIGGGEKGNGGLILKGAAVVDANEVLFHLVEDGQVLIGNDATLTATAPTDGDYKGFQFFQSRDNTASAVFKGIANCVGTMYFPVNHVEIAGQATCSTLMADTIELAANAKLTVNPGL